ncbi:hypothetical protein [Opitutus sp. ER46]|uniref:hypothetical protein n=1 Tax=Opitutus sp. ER46 TaxID=2161864 RepID=UPI000D3271CB|nr:hypothetical protein [Opitutus sp. ER46]PTX94614.1 hypothetical protein DB354_12855 [Opitutus sp. ER46]
MFTYAPTRWVPCLLLIWAGVAVTQAADPGANDAHDRLVQRTYNALGMDQEFVSARHEYLRFMKERSKSSGQDTIISHVGHRLITSDYRARICSFLASTFADDELSVLALYFESRGGQEMLRFERQSRALRNRPGNDVDAEARRFAEAQPQENQSAFRSFYDSPVGRRFRSKHQDLVGFVLNLVGQLGDEILAKMAAESTSHSSP